MAKLIVPIQDWANGTAPAAYWGNPITRAGTTLTVAGTYPNKYLSLTSTAFGTKVFSYLPLNSKSDLECLVKFRYTSDYGKQGIVALRYAGNSEATTKGYTMSGSFINSAGQIAIDEGSTGYNAYAAWNYLPNITYWARFRVQGSVQQVKVWTDGSVEPASWMATSNDTVQTVGSFSGLTTYSAGPSGPASIYYYFVSFGTDGDEAPYTEPSSSMLPFFG